MDNAARSRPEKRSLFIRRAAALAEMTADRNLLARPAEFGRIFYFVPRTPNSWATDQNGRLSKGVKGALHATTSSQYLKWLAASVGVLCIDCGSHYYRNCMSSSKQFSRRNRKGKGYEVRASAMAEQQRVDTSNLAEFYRLSVLELYPPFIQQLRRKRKPRKSGTRHSHSFATRTRRLASTMPSEEQKGALRAPFPRPNSARFDASTSRKTRYPQRAKSGA